MSLDCSVDAEGYIEISESMSASIEPCKCVECGKPISVGELHYSVYHWREVCEGDMDGLTEEEIDDMGDEITIGNYTACEACGDLAASVLEKGYCWTFGSLRDDINETVTEQGSI